MRRGFTGSAILHASVIALVVLGLPELFRPDPKEEVPVVFEMVTVSEKPAAPTQSLRPPPKPLPKPEPQQQAQAKPEPPKPEPPKVETPPPPPPPPPPPKPEPPRPEPPKVEPPPPPPKPEPPKPEPPPPPPKPEPPKPEPPKVEAPKPKPPEPPKPVAEAEPVAVPQAKPPPPKPEPPKVEQAKPEPPKPEPPKVEHAKPEPPKPQVAAKPELPRESKPAPPKPAETKRDTKPAADFDVNAVLNNLRPSPARQDQRPAPAPQQRTQTAAAAPTASAPNFASTLNSSEIDAVRQQVERCWSFFGGGKEVQHMEVDIRVWMNPDATVRDARIVDTGRYQSDPMFRSVAESGRRAILNPECSPLRLPRDKYDLWKTFTFTFRPRDFGT